MYIFQLNKIIIFLFTFTFSLLNIYNANIILAEGLIDIPANDSKFNPNNLMGCFLCIVTIFIIAYIFANSPGGGFDSSSIELAPTVDLTQISIVEQLNNQVKNQATVNDELFDYLNFLEIISKK